MITPVQPPPREALWFYVRDGRRFGPTDAAGLQVMADCRHLLPGCKVLKHGEEVPGIATDIEGLVFPPEPPPLPRTDSRYDRLYRSSDERVLLGLCGGLAHRWGVPALLVRAGMVVLLGFMVGWAYPFSVVFPALPTKDVRSPRQR